jgi:hypothetical protein
MRTFVRDFTGLGVHALPSSPRSRQRDRSASAAGELQFIGLAEALELTLLLADRDEKYDRAAFRWHARFTYETKNLDIRESVAVLAFLTAIPANRLAASALAELFSRRRTLERCAEALVRWARSP